MPDLRKYISKRDFSQSKEPKAKVEKSKGQLRFVIQKHAARRLHYDLRLEVDGVLKSWAVPKGPSLDPDVKRLAIMVEDHPIAYGKFEGVISKGYGAGRVWIWDHGYYTVKGQKKRESEQMMRQGLKNGLLHFELQGEKLHGSFALIKLKNTENEWLFVKSKDEFATKNEIVKTSQHEIVLPMLATLIDKPFDDPEWIFEIKLDGFRALASLQTKEVFLYSRNKKSFNERFPLIVKELEKLKLDAVVDGEIVALDEKGISHFQMLQNLEDDSNCYYYVFDLLSLNGQDMRHLPLIKRKAMLKKLLPKKGRVRYLDHVDTKGNEFFQLCEKHGCEGIIGKKAESIYQENFRSREWVKIKAENRQEFVIVGFTKPRASRKHFGALILGYYEKGKLQYAGHVGGGFTEKELKEIKKLLEPLIASDSAFLKPPKTNTAVTWVQPRLLCEVKFREWTSEGILRQPIFLGLREDKPTKLVKKELITNSDKLYWRKEKITKGTLIDYYESIAPFILPYLKNRPQSFKRFPNGIEGQSFFQKNLQNYPEWISTFRVEHESRDINYLLIQDQKSLIYAVNLGCIELHGWLSRKDKLENPDFLLFDLDPENISFDAVIECAQYLHQLLDSLKIPNYCKTSGKRGLHVVIPLNAKYTYEESKTFSQIIAVLVHQALPKTTSLERSPKNRQKKVYIDCFQNNFGQTIIVPYSVRAEPGAPVSTPLEWHEVKKGMRPQDFTIFNTLNRLETKGDLFAPALKKGADIKKALKRLEKIT